MPRKPRIHYTETDKALMWDRWRKGDSLEAIARLFDRIDRLELRVNAYITVSSDLALKQAQQLEAELDAGRQEAWNLGCVCRCR